MAFCWDGKAPSDGLQQLEELSCRHMRPSCLEVEAAAADGRKSLSCFCCTQFSCNAARVPLRSQCGPPRSVARPTLVEESVGQSPGVTNICHVRSCLGCIASHDRHLRFAASALDCLTNPWGQRSGSFRPRRATHCLPHPVVGQTTAKALLLARATFGSIFSAGQFWHADVGQKWRRFLLLRSLQDMPPLPREKVRSSSRYRLRYSLRHSYAYGDESDLDQNIGRLCQYLSGSEADEDETEEEEETKRATGGRAGQRSCDVKGFSVLRMGQLQSSQKPRRYSSYQQDQRCGVGAAPWARAVRHPYAREPTEMSGVMHRDLLNFSSAACRDAFDLPMPPRRPLPPLPDEPAYEEARSVRHAAGDSTLPAGAPAYYLSTNRSQMDPRGGVDWLTKYEPLTLECNENGSFLVPSSHTDSTSMSPSGHSDAQQNKNNYLLSPTSISRPPYPVVPSLSVHAMSLPCSSEQGCFRDMKHAKQQKLMELCCSWKCLTYVLTSALLFSLAVICYLLVVVTSNQPLPPQPTTIHYLADIDNVETDVNLPSVAKPPLRPLPGSFALGDVVIADLPPGVLVASEFLLLRDAHVQFNTSLAPQTKLAFFLRQTLPPSVTQYDFHEIVHGSKLHAPAKRSLLQPYGQPFHQQNTRLMSFVHYLSSGRWYVGFINDDEKLRTIRFSASTTETNKEKCKYDCFEKGLCSEGRCICLDGFAGEFCEKSVCPAVCSGNGLFSGGRCHCHRGWKGGNCDVPFNLCEVPDCNGHGHCGRDGQCHCKPGYRGEFCDEPDCPVSDCSGKGVCIKGLCYCGNGWRGDACDEPFSAELLCSAVSICSKHGEFDAATGTCVCQKGWTGPSCENRICSLDCGSHGSCIGSGCRCEPGWTGAFCNQIACLPGCNDHGQCKNGSCECNTGWNGLNCHIAGCPENCSNHGSCQRNEANEWMCICDSNFSGDDCQVPIESQCSDNVDNDNDGLTDCEDSECCLTSSRCSSDSLCQTVTDPLRALMRKQTPPRHASFFQKTKFIVEQDSVQLYADVALFNGSRVSVLRGRIVNEQGGILAGVRITDTSNALYGFTLSRLDGHFDLLVNGGGSVTLQLTRLPFGSTYRTYPVTWNTIVNIGDIVMSKDASLSRSAILTETCKRVHREHTFCPILRPAWRDDSNLFPSEEIAKKEQIDGNVVEESIPMLGTNLQLIYLSATAPEYKSLLHMVLLPSVLPESIRLVKLNIDVEGVHFSKVLSPEPNLTYIFQWDMLNAYKQKVYGLVLASVAVGYVYAECREPLWLRSLVKVNGVQSSTSDIGGLNLNVHHYLDVNNGILENGDGSVLYLKEEEPLLVTILGSGRQRPIDCSNCNVPLEEVSFYMPSAVASSKDGSLYVGDHTLIRRRSPNGIMQTVLQLGAADVAHQYHLAVHPFSGDLYVSLPSRRQIVRVLSPLSTSDFSLTNYEAVVGSGEACFVGETCGDGGPAEIAKLNYPKGIAFDAYGNLFIADELRIRLVTVDGLIKTLIDSNADVDVGSGSSAPSSCSLQFVGNEFHLSWPTELAYDVTGQRLIFLDSDVLYEYLPDISLVRRLQGVPSHCSSSKLSRDSTSARPTILKSVTSLAVSKAGIIAISETDYKQLHRVRMFDLHGQVLRTIGGEHTCSCDQKNCPCSDQKAELASFVHLNKPTALAYDEADTLYVVDQGSLKVRALRPPMPVLNPLDHMYHVQSQSSPEVFVFNEFGQHVFTRDTTSGRHLFNFSYHLDTSYGKLIRVTDADGMQIFINRKKQNKITIEIPEGKQLTLNLNPINRMVESVSGAHPLGSLFFAYLDNTSLLKNLTDSSGRQRLFDYDSSGRLASAKLAVAGSLNKLHQR
uniref:EGF-like domain-containing protein n=1 Tax=Trichuris muris TaxID=70415 RepID=A0A5S6QLT2_TRIMR